jgi:hypothetical protein
MPSSWHLASFRHGDSRRSPHTTSCTIDSAECCRTSASTVPMRPRPIADTTCTSSPERACSAVRWEHWAGQWLSTCQ